MHFRLEGTAFIAVAVTSLCRLQVNLHHVELVEAVLKQVRLAVEGCSTDDVANNTVLVALAEADVANFVQAAASSHELLDHWHVAGAGSLDNEG